MTAPGPVEAASGVPVGVRGGGRVWAYLGIVVGAVVSVAANVAHSFVRPHDVPDTMAWRPEVGAVLGAMFWPIALLITTEIMARTRWPVGLWWIVLRFLGLLPVAGVAAVVSYLHLHGLLHHYHEDDLTTVIAPFSVDGLMVMASSALVAGHKTPSPTATAIESSPTNTVLATASTQRPADDQNDVDAARSARPATAEAVLQLATRDPGMSTEAIAAELGVSTRTVRRYLAGNRQAGHRGAAARGARQSPGQDDAA